MAPSNEPRTYYERLDRFERSLLREALDASDGDILRAAAALRLAPAVFELKSERLGLLPRLRAAGIPRGQFQPR